MNEALPAPEPPKRAWSLWIALVPAIIVVFLWLAATYESTIRSFSPGCIFHRVTGLNCPGCGATRAVFAISKGDFSTAWRMNPLLMIGLAAGAFYFVLAILKRRPGSRLENKAWTRVSDRAVRRWIIVAVLLFGVLRNIPVWPLTLLALIERKAIPALAGSLPGR